MIPFPDIVVNTPEVTLPSTNWSSPLFWGPLLVSMFALLGVVYTNWRTGKNLIRAENLRAANALEAEAARHSNELRRAEEDWRREIRSRSYFELIANLKNVSGYTAQMIWFLRKSPTKEEAVNASEAYKMLKRAQNGTREVDRLIATIRAVGSTEVADKANRIGNICHAARSSATKGLSAGGGLGYLRDHKKRYKRFSREAADETRHLIRMVRDELLLEGLPGGEAGEPQVASSVLAGGVDPTP